MLGVRNAGRSSWRWIQRAAIWRGRDDPLGDLTPHLEDVIPILTGPIDNYTPRVVPWRQVDALIADQFAELNVEAIWQRIGFYRCRFRRIKPLHYREVVYPPVYGMVFGDPNKPLFVDIGSGDGKILMLLAKRNPDMNYLGLEKREKRVELSDRFKQVLGLKNLHFISCNATISFKTLLATYPGPIMYVTIIGPDPHLKGEYFPIRMVTKNLVEQILDCVSPGGKIFFQTEFNRVADYFRRYFDQHLGTYVSVVDEGNTGVYDDDGWLLMNPLGVRSETEIDVVAHGEKMWRRLYERSDQKFVKLKPLTDALKCRLEAPNHPEPTTKQERQWNKFVFPIRRKYRDRRCPSNQVRKLPVGVARDIILNWETYPRGWFARLMESKRLKKPKRIRDPKPRIRPIHKRHKYGES